MKLLRMLERDCTLTTAQLACALRADEQEVKDEIAEYERQGAILGYKAIVDWEKTDREMVTALIDVKVTPVRGEGFDRVAGRIYQYPEVETLYLMSGGYDLCVVIRGRTLKEVAMFVAEKLAPMEFVTGTATHFLLKKYKEGGIVFEKESKQEERIQMV